MAEMMEQASVSLHLEEQNMVVGEDEFKEGGVSKRKNRKKRSHEDVDGDAEKRGVCYLSRVPPHMNPSHIRQILSRFGETHRIYLVPEDSTIQVRRDKAGGFRGKEFSEGWVEFAKRSVAKKVANLLNGEQMGGKKRSSFYYDIWNIKYLRKFKWDDLISEIANKNRIREQKLNMEISAAKRERDFYLSKVEQSRALNFIQERRKKKQKSGEAESDGPDEPKMIRQFPQNRTVADGRVQTKTKISKDILAGVFGGGS